MAFYVVQYNGKRYMNIDLAKSYFNKGNTSFLLSLAKQEIPSEVLFGTQLIPVDNKTFGVVSTMFQNVVYQNIDARLKDFVKPTAAEFIACEKIRRCKHVFSGTEDKFLKFVEVPYSGKYNKKNDIPTIKVCANLFIVAGKVIKGREKESILFLTDEE